MLSKKLFPQQILKLIFLSVKQMAFTLMNEEFEFLCCLMTPSFNKDFRPHSQQLYSHQLLSINCYLFVVWWRLASQGL